MFSPTDWMRIAWSFLLMTVTPTTWSGSKAGTMITLPTPTSIFGFRASMDE